MNLVNSQGTKVYILDVPGTPWATTGAAVTAIQGGALVGCPQSIGNIEETRSVKEYTCMTTNDSMKSLGSITRGNIQIGLLFDPSDAAGQAALKAAFASNTQKVIAVELPNKGTTNGTIFWFVAGISGVSLGIVQDEAITYDVTAEIASAVTELAKV